MATIDINSKEFLNILKLGIGKLETLLEQKLGVKITLYVDVHSKKNGTVKYIELSSLDIKNLLGVLGSAMFTKLEFTTWGGDIVEGRDEVYLTPKMFFKVHGGGTNGLTLGNDWDIVFNLNTLEWSIRD